MGNKSGIVQRCGVAVAALALLSPTTSRPATQAESPVAGSLVCLSNEQRTELLHREMLEFKQVGYELVQSKRDVRNAVTAHDGALAALKACEAAGGPVPASPCTAEHEKLDRTNAELRRAVEHRDKTNTDFPVLAASRISAIRTEYPACDSR